MDTPEKIPLEALVKWLNAKLKAAKKTISLKTEESNSLTAEVTDLRKQISDRDKGIAKKQARIETLEAEIRNFQKDARNTDWCKSLRNEVAEKNESLRNLRRNYNSVLMELNRLREKHGE